MVRDNIYQSDAVENPMVVGVLKPRIILPTSITEQYDFLSYIIAHENTHIKRGDNLWRMVATTIACIYWFNPFIWIILKAFFVDMELACDETTIRKYPIEDRKNYAAALLTVSQKDPFVYATAFTSGNVKVRIKRVLNYRQGTIVSTIFLFLLFLKYSIFSTTTALCLHKDMGH